MQRWRAILGTRALLVGVTVGVAGAWRIWLAGHYAGWEESDYGNLAMIRGVLDGGFRHYDMNHMPGYYALGAAVLAVVGDTVLAARGTAVVMGLLAYILAVLLADRLAGRRVAWLTGLLLAFQPELALYSSTSLREPIYAGWVLAALFSLVSERLLLAGVFAALAFSVRMDGALALAPALLVHALGRGDRVRRLLSAFLPLLLAMGAWSAYCAAEHGTALFWSHSVEVNIETGLGAEAVDRWSWVENGLSVVFGLAAGLLPSRIGWAVWAGVFYAVVHTPWLRHDPRRTWAIQGIVMAGVWCGIGFVGQHAPDHNLYWKWMSPFVPLLVPIGLSGLLGALDRLRARLPAAPPLLLGLALAQALVGYGFETHRQFWLSEALYRPQEELAQWVEANVPESVPMLFDDIPACYINRNPHERRMVSWFDVPSEPGDPESFAAFLQAEHIGWVLWFAEDWTQAPRFAPFLREGGTWESGGVRLVEVRREDQYGWIFFEAQGTD